MADSPSIWRKFVSLPIWRRLVSPPIWGKYIRRLFQPVWVLVLPLIFGGAMLIRLMLGASSIVGDDVLAAAGFAVFYWLVWTFDHTFIFPDEDSQVEQSREDAVE